MTRLITTPPDFSGAALAALKEWLAITTAREDALLIRLLASAHETCERFTGLMPLACGVEEQFDPAPCLAVKTRPVRAVTSVAWLDAAGVAAAIDPATWTQVIAAGGACTVRLDAPPAEGRVVIAFTAGIADGWAAIPPALGDGILRLAAHGYRSREGVASEPPAAVAALWRAWRRLRL